MSYLPDYIPNAKVLMTVKTYPNLSRKYGELVCTAGILENKKWIRIYPIRFRSLEYYNRFKKYQWIELNLQRNTKDFRPDSYRPDGEDIKLLDTIGTDNKWEVRKEYVLHEVFDSMNDLITLAKSDKRKSLATLKPKEIIDFVIEENERDWPEEKKAYFQQPDLFQEIKALALKKLPYKYSYRFITEGDSKPRKMMIEDWEIGQLYWNCLKDADGDEDIANQKVKQKFLDSFSDKKDLYLLVGTTKANHLRARNPFIIIGIFYPPKEGDMIQTSLFEI